MKYFYVTYETVDGEHEYQESGVLQAGDYVKAVAKAETAKPLFDRYGWEEFCRQDNVMDGVVLAASASVSYACINEPEEPD